MKVNVKNTKMVLKDMEEDFSCPIPFSKKDYNKAPENPRL